MIGSTVVATQNVLERVQTLLPTAVALDTNLDTSEDHLFTPAKVDTQLDDITILYSEGF